MIAPAEPAVVSPLPWMIRHAALVRLDGCGQHAKVTVKIGQVTVVLNRGFYGRKAVRSSASYPLPAWSMKTNTWFGLSSSIAGTSTVDFTAPNCTGPAATLTITVTK